MKICQFVADLVRRSVSVGEVVVGFCSLPWCLGGSSFSIIPKLDFVGFARLARDCVEDLGGVRFILPAACVAERMVLGAWRCLVLRRRLSGSCSSSLWSFVLSLLSPFHERKLSLVLREVSWVVSYRVRGHGAPFYSSSTYHPSVEVPHLIALGRYSLVLLSAGMKPLSFCVLIRQRFFKCGLE
ncbi:hypothetical protein F2Q69_00012030 [Brassica cretica]|uniref:Uncharacterized protein n=1 Tax=Brassica cretica TaxID=69181 RepID=A0A8S9QGS7_BRACR|nr:hypothetical protein F2Q69_00012030 [Brassica cretica]